jgi:hypothetical protein
VRPTNSQYTDACGWWCVDGRWWMYRQIDEPTDLDLSKAVLRISVLSPLGISTTQMFFLFLGVGSHGEIEKNLRVVEKQILPPFPLCSVHFLIDKVLPCWKGSKEWFFFFMSPYIYIYSVYLSTTYVRGFVQRFLFFFSFRYSLLWLRASYG